MYEGHTEKAKGGVGLVVGDGGGGGEMETHVLEKVLCICSYSQSKNCFFFRQILVCINFIQSLLFLLEKIAPKKEKIIISFLYLG